MNFIGLRRRLAIQVLDKSYSELSEEETRKIDAMVDLRTDQTPKVPEIEGER